MARAPPRLPAGEVERRDYVLGPKQRPEAIMLRRSRAAVEGGVVDVEL